MPSGGAYFFVVNCPTRWSLSFIFGFLYWSSSWRWGPHIGVCRLLWPLPRAGMAVLTQFFAKCILYMHPGAPKKFDNFLGVLPPETASFLGGGPWLPRFPELGFCWQRTPFLAKCRTAFITGWSSIMMYQHDNYDEGKWFQTGKTTADGRNHLFVNAVVFSLKLILW